MTSEASETPQLPELATALLETINDRATRVATEVRDRVGLYGDKAAVPLDDLVQSCRDNLSFVLSGLAEGRVGDPRPAAETGVRRARAGVPLSSVLAAYRVGFRAMWEQVTAEAALRGVPAAVVLEATADAMVAHDVFTEAMAAAYNETLTEQLVRQEAERSALVETVLGGTVVDRRTLWEVADLLGLPVSGTYVVVAALLAAPGRAVLHGVESELARQGIRSAWRLLADAQVGVVDVAGTDVETVLELLGTGSVRLGVSPAFHELTAAAGALELARLAAASSPRAGGHARFEDHPVGVAAAAAGHVMEHLTTDVLGPLAVLPDGDRATLLETLRVWVAAGGSNTKAAQRLACHANTVRHRLRRFEELTGRRLEKPLDVAALCLALESTRG